MLKNKASSVVLNLSCNLKSMFANCKLRASIIYVFVALGLILGVVVAVRLNNNGLIEDASNYGYVGTSVFGVKFSSTLWRLLSSIIMMLLLVVFSLSIFLYPIGVVLLIYKAYLIGLNIVILLLTNGLASIIISLLILLPCQILLILILSSFFAIYSSQCKDDHNQRGRIILIFFLLLLILNLLEGLLLLIFGANLFFVI